MLGYDVVCKAVSGHIDVAGRLIAQEQLGHAALHRYERPRQAEGEMMTKLYLTPLTFKLPVEGKYLATMAVM